MPAVGKARRAAPRVGIVVSRFNEAVTRRLLTGAEHCLAARRVPAGRVDVYWVAGAWELPVVVRGLVATGRYEAIAALGAVIRGETLHYEIIAGEAARGLMAVAVGHGVPVGFGVLTCDTEEQALARSGGAEGNKGYDAVAAALDAAATLRAGGDVPPRQHRAGGAKNARSRREPPPAQRGHPR
jgi:6,7-dimethyl-8-ribityllumazine synthase